MPRKQYKKRRTMRKRQYKKSYRGRRSKVTTSLIRSPTVAPDRLKVKLKYVDVYNIGVATGTQNYNLFSGNSIHDPDATGVGHQPLGHDQWNAFYEKYYVYGSSINIKFLSDSDGFIFIVPQTSTTYTGSLALVKEQPYNKILAYNNAGPARNMMKSYMATTKILGQKGMNEKDGGTQFGTNPQQRWYWVVGAYDPVGSTLGPVTFTVIVEIVYYCVLFDRVDRIAQS